MAQASSHASDTAGDATAKTVDVESEGEGLLDLVADGVGGLVTAQVDNGYARWMHNKRMSRDPNSNRSTKHKLCRAGTELTDGVLAVQAEGAQGHLEAEQEVVHGEGGGEVALDGVHARLQVGGLGAELEPALLHRDLGAGAGAAKREKCPLL